MREEKPFRHDRLVRHALGAVVNGGFQSVEVPQPAGLLLIGARGIKIFDHNPVLAEIVVEPAITKECERVWRTPDLLRGLLRAEDPILSPLDGPEAINEIARGEAPKTAVPIRIQKISAHTAEFVHLHCITGRRPSSEVLQGGNKSGPRPLSPQFPGTGESGRLRLLRPGRRK